MLSSMIPARLRAAVFLLVVVLFRPLFQRVPEQQQKSDSYYTKGSQASESDSSARARL